MARKTVSTISSAVWVFAAGELAAFTSLGPWVAYIAWPVLAAGLSGLTLRLLGRQGQT